VKPPTLDVHTEQRPVGMVRVVFYLRADQAAALHEEAVRHGEFKLQYESGKGRRVNVTQVVRDALVAAGVIPK
jgi:hypothetical protein